MLRGRADERQWDKNHISMSTMHGTNGQMMQRVSEGRVTRGTEPQELLEHVQVLADKRMQDGEL